MFEKWRCTHEWHPVQVYVYPADAPGEFYTKEDIYCPKCRKLKLRVPLSKVERLIKIQEIQADYDRDNKKWGIMK